MSDKTYKMKSKEYYNTTSYNFDTTTYRKKYLKYKSKYNKLKTIVEFYNIIGGAKVPDVLPATQSWLYMPVLLMPFTDVSVNFPDEFNDILMSTSAELGFELFSFEAIVNKIKETYEAQCISNFSDRNNITSIRVTHNRDGVDVVENVRFDDASRLHLRGEDQEKLLELADVNVILESIAGKIVESLKGMDFTFELAT
jgi:hypothetical protein